MSALSIRLRHPRLEDAPELHRITHETGVLDLNSVYAYVLVCDHWAATSVVAENTETKEILGFISAYRLPEEPATLFVWQVAVVAAARGQRLASRMLERVVTGPQAPRIRHVHTTITPDNTASVRLFTGLARAADCPLQTPDTYPAAVLGPDPTAHAAEVHHRIGPFPAAADAPHRTIISAWSSPT